MYLVWNSDDQIPTMPWCCRPTVSACWMRAFLLGDDEGVTINLMNRDNTALSREDMQFITLGTPDAAKAGLDLVLSGSNGYSAVAVLKNKGLNSAPCCSNGLFVKRGHRAKSVAKLQRLFCRPRRSACLLDVNGKRPGRQGQLWKQLDGQLG